MDSNPNTVSPFLFDKLFRFINQFYSIARLAVVKCCPYIFNIEGEHAEVKKRVKYYDKNNYFFESVERSWRGQLKCF